MKQAILKQDSIYRHQICFTLQMELRKESMLRPFLDEAADGCTGYSKEQMKQAILKQYSIYRHHGQELHRLYKRRRDLMNQLTKKDHCNVTMLTEAQT
ncbi:hypothetical protein Tco_1010560 [Tanacetum coccineum]